MEFAPQEGRARKGDGEKILVIDGDARAILRRTLPGAFLIPAFQAKVPKGQGLHGRSLHGFVWADEHHGIPSSIPTSPKRLKL